MPIKEILMEQRLHAGARLFQTVIRGNAVYLAGHVADDPSQDVPGQTRQILAAIDRLLTDAGTYRTMSCRPRSISPATARSRR